MAPVNPHSETYQGKTQFSGPVMAGTRWNGANADYAGLQASTNPIAVSKLANAGYVVCSQSCAVDQTVAGTRTVTDIMLPPGSMIISIQYIVTTAFDGSTGDLRLGFDPGGSSASFSYITKETTLEAVGVYNVLPHSDTASHVERWRNISDPARIAGAEPGVSLDVRSICANTGSGRAIVTMNYIPGFNFPLI